MELYCAFGEILEAIFKTKMARRFLKRFGKSDLDEDSDKIMEVIKMLDYDADHYCPAYKKIICADLCYDSLCCLLGEFKISSTKELSEIEDIEEARILCRECPYSDLGGGMDEWIPGPDDIGLLKKE